MEKYLLGKVKIKDIYWNIYLIPNKYYIRKDRDSYAITETFEKYIAFNEKTVDIRIIIHEVVHAFYSSCLIDDATSIDTGATEEIFCNILAYHLDDIINISYSIYQKIRESIKINNTKLDKFRIFNPHPNHKKILNLLLKLDDKA